MGQDLPIGERTRRSVLPREVQQVRCVTGGVSGNRYVPCRAGGEVVFGNRDCLLQLQRGLDHGRDETCSDVPFYVAVEEPDTYVSRRQVSATAGRYEDIRQTSKGT